MNWNRFEIPFKIESNNKQIELDQRRDKRSGRLLLSLDFELHWGVFDHTNLDASGRAYFDRTRALIPPTLALFREFGIRATWATVGALMARNREQLLTLAPTVRPDYEKERLNAYALLEDGVGESEADDPYHYAPSLVEQILATPGQELGSHTFSHYYCLEPNRSRTAFAADLAATQAIARENFGVTLRSLVFPRNQYAADYLPLLAENGYRTYRTNPDQWFWRAEAATEEGPAKKAVRLLDHYLPFDFFSAGGGSRNAEKKHHLIPLPASRFFRPYLPRLDGFGGQALKLRRIEAEMSRAARTGTDYHLWWHPHNLATDPERNMAALKRILTHFRGLSERYGMESASMGEVVGDGGA